MAQRATSLGPKPLLISFFVFVFCSLFCFFCFFVLFFFFWFCFFGCLIQKKPLFFPKKWAFFVYFQCFSFFSLSPFGPPSFSVSLSLYLFFLLFFLSSFLSLFLLSFGSLFFSLSFFLSLSSLLFFHERNNIKILNCKFFFLKSFLFFKFPAFFVSSSFFLSLLFPDFKLCFLFNIKVFGFKTKNLKNIFCPKGGLQQNGFFYQPVFCKMSKAIVFFGHFLAIFG